MLNALLAPARRRGPSSDHRLVAHVARLAEEHPPIDLASCDFTVRRPQVVVGRFAPVLDYMARAELEVERNALELSVLLPHAPDVDRYFYRDVWQPQEAHHGLALDELQVRLGLPPALTDLDTLSPKIRAVGALAHVSALQDVVRMLYYLTGMTTERSALLAYHRLEEGLAELGETAVIETVIAPIRRQEPGHFAFYQMSARGLWAELAEWQRWLVRRLRAVSFAPVAAGDDERRADVGDMMVALGIGTPEATEEFLRTVARTEAELLGAAAPSPPPDHPTHSPACCPACARAHCGQHEASAGRAVPGDLRARVAGEHGVDQRRHRRDGEQRRQHPADRASPPVQGRGEHGHHGEGQHRQPEDLGALLVGLHQLQQRAAVLVGLDQRLAGEVGDPDGHRGGHREGDHGPPQPVAPPRHDGVRHGQQGRERREDDGCVDGEGMQRQAVDLHGLNVAPPRWAVAESSLCFRGHLTP